jgi:hypothetical protein
MKNYLLLFILCLAFINVQAQQDLTYYLPTDVTYNPDIPTPKEVIGHQVGEWHITHDKLLLYMETLATVSDRMTIKEHGRTFENRPLVSLTVTSPNNHQNLEQLRTDHLKLSDPSQSAGLQTDNMPLVTYLGYSVHGNEPSGSNASLLVAYYLAAAQGEAIDELLSNTIIQLDPSINPDGLNRYASWVNSNRNMSPVADGNDIEHDETWPGGRTNHYWFDLNRDWLPAQLPESQARLTNYHNWKPNILTDHHEMGTNNTFFFQPGIPSRNNPLTPAKNYELTGAIAKYHAAALDKIGSLYYSKESFDDFYYGKGSTYPDINGSVGILFEQARVEGHVQESSNGLLTFPFAVRNHFTASLSTLEAGKFLRVDMLNYQREFYKSAISKANSDADKAYIVGSNDQQRMDAFVTMLKRHQIDISPTTKQVNTGGKSFAKQSSYVIPLQQPQYRLIKSIFEKRTSFQDSLFYDVSAWNLGLAFGLDYATLNSKQFQSDLAGSQGADDLTPLAKSNYAYALDWSAYYAHKALNMLHTKGIITKVATASFTDTNRTYPMGTILISVGIQHANATKMHELLSNIQKTCGVQIYPIESGHTAGVNLGSPQFRTVKKQRTLLLVGDGVSGYDAGEVRHLLDYRMGMPIASVKISRFNRTDISKYQTIIMVDGSYGSLNANKVKTWVQGGGNIIAMKRAAKWLKDKGISDASFKKRPKDSTSYQLPYDSRSKVSGAQAIGGSIFAATLDRTHPLGFGYGQDEISVFRRGTLFMEKAQNPFVNPLVYTDNPLQAGYISKDNLKSIKGSAVINVSHFGQGRVISFADNPNFRAFWYGTNRLFLNSLYFAQVIDRGRTR